MKEYIVQAFARETIESFDSYNAPELVRCKDCKFGTPYEVDGAALVDCGDEVSHDADWFCADGKRK